MSSLVPYARSPYNLLQEIYFPDVWKILICTMLLNLTTRRQVDRVRDELFRRWPTPQAMSGADRLELACLIKELGLSNKRSASLIRMSREFLEKEWTRPVELHGLGQYAQDSYDIFVFGRLVESPSDKYLSRYVGWARWARAYGLEKNFGKCFRNKIFYTLASPNHKTCNHFYRRSAW